ncbi:serine-arginine protein 55-like [Rhopilema esculentum]|uniref:serine-arginine protein 55-like n=1 Tax=Rhopilema esculentum TaxID=499914 RepID=UPI0031DB6423|eukprot:gene6920-12535_t
MSRSSSGYKVFVGRIPNDARTRDLENFFKDHGFSKCIRDINLKNGFAFVEFDDYRDADDAVYELNHKELLGTRIALEHARPNKEKYDRRDRFDRYGGGGGGGRGGGFRFRDKYGSPYNTDYRVIVENLSTRAGWQDLKDYFRQHGEVTFTKCHREKVGEGVVEFARYSDVKESIRKLDGTELMGKRIRLIDDTPKDMRKGRSASRSRSRSRSPRRRSYERSRSRSPRRRSYERSRSRSKSPDLQKED